MSARSKNRRDGVGYALLPGKKRAICNFEILIARTAEFAGQLAASARCRRVVRCGRRPSAQRLCNEIHRNNHLNSLPEIFKAREHSYARLHSFAFLTVTKNLDLFADLFCFIFMDAYFRTKRRLKESVSQRRQ